MWDKSNKIIVISVLIFLVSQRLSGATFNPVSIADLVNAITTSNGNNQDDTIDLGAATFSLTAVNNTTDGQNGLPSITESGFSLTIKNGAIQRTGANALRLLHVSSTGRLILENVTLSSGSAQESGAGVGQGGALFSRGSLSIDGCTFSSNIASSSNGVLTPADGFGGAIYAASGTISSIKNSDFISNQAQGGNSLTTLLAAVSFTFNE